LPLVPTAPPPPQVTETPSGDPMSRAGFATEVRAITALIAQKLDKAAAVSRAGFAEEAMKIVAEHLLVLGKACA